MESTPVRLNDNIEPMTAEFHDTGDFTDILYKYTDLAGAQKILSTRTLRFARAAELNDPFDVYIADLFGMDLDEFFAEARDSFFDALLSNPEQFAAAIGADLTKAFEHATRLRNMPDMERVEVRDRLRQIDFAEVDAGYREIRATLEKQRDGLVERFRHYGIFCATKTFSNLLMWAHYADKHFGAVLGFLPDLEKDSFLRLIRPVVYCTERPHLVEHPREQIAGGLGPTPLNAGTQLNRRVLHTKSMEWSYEEELRLTFPEEIKEGMSATFNTFYANELVEVYLGYRMDDDSKTEIIHLAKALNPNVKIFTARLARRKYAMEFDPI